MRIVFMGTPQFAADILEEIARVHEVVAVYTMPDAVRGRGKALVASPVKTIASNLGIRVVETKSLRDDAIQAELKSFEPDAICVAAYGAILPKAVLEIPKFGCLNVHASLLPRWRGAAPIERAVLAGDEEVGVCIMRMEEGLDTGAYCVSRSIPVAGRSAAELTGELADLGSRAVLTALAHIEEGKANWVEQDEANVTYADKIDKQELALDPELDAETNRRRVAASGPAHPAKCELAGKTVRIMKAALPEHEISGIEQMTPGDAAFISKRLYLFCSDGPLEIIELKPDGKREMSAKEFAAGVPGFKNGFVKWSAVK